MTAETIHTCSYECERPECIRAQRDELAARLTAETSNARGDAEAKTVPVPTRVRLIGETAVIVGTPGRGWDEDWPDAHNCDAMGCATIGPHVLARVPFTDERALPQAAEARGVVDLTKVRNNVLAVIPGGSICDPQQVADDVRAVFSIFEAEARRAALTEYAAAQTAEIEALRAEVSAVKESLSTDLRAMRAERERAMEARQLISDDLATAESRAERLAEAISAYKSECDNPAKDYVLRAKRRDEMFTLLREQEEGNGQ